MHLKLRDRRGQSFGMVFCAHGCDPFGALTLPVMGSPSKTAALGAMQSLALALALFWIVARTNTFMPRPSVLLQN